MVLVGDAEAVLDRLQEAVLLPVLVLFVGPRLSAQEEDVKKISFKTSDEVSLQAGLLVAPAAGIVAVVFCFALEGRRSR